MKHITTIHGLNAYAVVYRGAEGIYCVDCNIIGADVHSHDYDTLDAAMSAARVFADIE